MELKDIIRSDADRLFILDNECYIIFTGDTIEDDKPFIRIGNWIKLPVEIIPLIENIIIPDLIIGNPSHEQFNIDVNYLATNRYIGSEQIVKRYLDFQRSFELDLTNANVVNIERDLPAFSREKIISDRDSFIGIFYTDGNFRVTHNKQSLFNLKELEANNLHDVKIHEILSQANHEGSRYAGCGLVFVQSTPLFYKNRRFSAYHFPRLYYEDFRRLQIDPGQIRDVLLPASNLMNVTKLLKWKHSMRGRLRIFSDHREDIDRLQRLFSSVSFVRQGFKGAGFDTGEGMHFQNYPGSYNLRIAVKKSKPSGEDLTLAYIKGHAGIQPILKERLDGVLVHSSVYEDMNLYFKSASAPIALLLDRGQKAESLRRMGHTIIYPGAQYEFSKYARAEELEADISATIARRELVGRIESGDPSSLQSELSEFKSSGQGEPFDAFRDIRNILALMRLRRATTTDRRLSASLKKAIDEALPLADMEGILGDERPFRVRLAFCAGAIFDFIEPLEGRTGGRVDVLFDEIGDDSAQQLGFAHDEKLRAYYERIATDRKRLEDLLRLFAPKTDRKELQALKSAIEKKKMHYDSDSLDLPGREARNEVRTLKLKKALKIALVPIAAALLLFASYLAYDYYGRYRIAQRDAAEKRRIEDLIKKYGIAVADRDIYLYANEVAVRNGYSPIAYATLKARNPNWIYPGNVFILLDGEKVIVKEGDTLWGISHNRLLRAKIDFYTRMEAILSGLDEGRDMRAEIQAIRKQAANDAQRAHLEKALESRGK